MTSFQYWVERVQEHGFEVERKECSVSQLPALTSSHGGKVKDMHLMIYLYNDATQHK